MNKQTKRKEKEGNNKNRHNYIQIIVFGKN